MEATEAAEAAAAAADLYRVPVSGDREMFICVGGSNSSGGSGGKVPMVVTDGQQVWRGSISDEKDGQVSARARAKEWFQGAAAMASSGVDKFELSLDVSSESGEDTLKVVKSNDRGRLIKERLTLTRQAADQDSESAAGSAAGDIRGILGQCVAGLEARTAALAAAEARMAELQRSVDLLRKTSTKLADERRSERDNMLVAFCKILNEKKAFLAAGQEGDGERGGGDDDEGSRDGRDREEEEEEDVEAEAKAKAKVKAAPKASKASKAAAQSRKRPARDKAGSADKAAAAPAAKTARQEEQEKPLTPPHPLFSLQPSRSKPGQMRLVYDAAITVVGGSESETAQLVASRAPAWGASGIHPNFERFMLRYPGKQFEVSNKGSAVPNVKVFSMKLPADDGQAQGKESIEGEGDSWMEFG